MTIERSVEVAEKPIRVSPESAVKQLEHLYRSKIDRLMTEFETLLPQRYTTVDTLTCARVQAELELAVAYSYDCPTNIGILERILNCLVKQQRILTNTLNQSEYYKED